MTDLHFDPYLEIDLRRICAPLNPAPDVLVVREQLRDTRGGGGDLLEEGTIDHQSCPTAINMAGRQGDQAGFLGFECRCHSSLCSAVLQEKFTHLYSLAHPDNFNRQSSNLASGR